MRDSLERLPEQLGAWLGIPGLRWDGQRRLFLACEGLPVLVAATERALRLSARLGTLPGGDKRLFLAEALLAANHFFCLTGGAALAFAPRSDEIWLHQELPLPATAWDTVRFQACFEAFVETAATWFDRLNPAETGASPLPPETPYA